MNGLTIDTMNDSTIRLRAGFAICLVAGFTIGPMIDISIAVTVSLTVSLTAYPIYFLGTDGPGK